MRASKRKRRRTAPRPPPEPSWFRRLSESATGDLVVGRICGVFGIKGWVKIRSYTEPAENLFAYSDWKLRRQGRWEPIEIDGGRPHGKGLIAHIVGIDDRDAAEQFNNSDIAVSRSQLPALEQDEFYWHQLQGLEVHADGQLLGKVDHLLETGANDVLVVKATAGSIDDRERLIPWIRGQVIRSVDLETGTVDVDWDPEF